MSEFKELYKSDMARYQNKPCRWEKKFHYFLRKAQTAKNRLLKLYYKFRLKMITNSHGIEWSSNVKVGKGLYLCHSYNITINVNAEIGENCNIHKNVTIGQENRGERKGSPKIGNSVWIGIGATVVGNVVIGDDVLIAPGAFVNCNVPSHSVVIGNPCFIKQSENATKDYVCHKY